MNPINAAEMLNGALPAGTNSNAVPTGSFTASYSEKGDDTGEGGDDEGGDDDDDDDEEEETSSELSDGDDLRDELEDALNSDFDFKGDFYHSETLSVAPNPCLHIEGLGAIGLPLTHRDADLLIKYSTQAPFGQGTQLVVNPRVRHTWEIEPARVGFLNTEWANFMQTTVVQSVLNALGVTSGASQPRCELYKLLLYEPGSHFLPHQDTEKAPGMFATIIVVLPALFTGGEVHVTHGSKSHVIDVSTRSMTATSILAWYTDVTHEVKPVTSGFRLALSYNLIHTSNSVPRPRIPSENWAVEQLRRTLRKWKEERYYELPEDDRLAYILDHQYSAQSLRNGLRALKGSDAPLVSQLKEIAEELGFHIFLGSLKYSQTGSTDGDGGYNYSSYHHGYRKRRRYYGCAYDEIDEDEDDASGMTMDEVFNTTISLNNVVDLNGVALNGANITLEEDNLIPKDPFEDADPDGKEYEGYMGNYPGDLEQWYSRSVVLIVNGNSVDHITQFAGAQYHLAQLAKSDLNHPSARDRQKANSIASSLKPVDRDSAKYLLDLSLKWKDAGLWKIVMTKSSNVSTHTTFEFDKFTVAMASFGFSAVQPYIEAIAKSISCLQARIDFIQKLSRNAGDSARPEIDAWCAQQYNSAVEALETPKSDDIPTLLSIGREKGIEYLIEKFFPSLTKRLGPDFDFLVAFLQSLHGVRNTFSGSPTCPPNLDAAVDRLLKLVISQWDTIVAQPMGYYGAYHNANPSSQAKVQRVMKILELCSSLGRLNDAKPLFAQLLNIKEVKTTQFPQFYTPLISQLRPFMVRCSIDVSSTDTCFPSFIRILVERYLHDVLGGPAPSTRIQVRKIGCGCMDCNTIDQYLAKETLREQQLFRMAKPRRLHVESHLAAARDLVGYLVVNSGTPHGVMVVKTTALVATQAWNCRVREALAFLANVGDDATLHKLMGAARFENVRAAIKGTRVYSLDRAHREAVAAFASNGSSAPGPSVGPSRTVPLTILRNPPATLAGQKRKEREGNTVNLGFVDLTGED